MSDIPVESINWQKFGHFEVHCKTKKEKEKEKAHRKMDKVLAELPVPFRLSLQPFPSTLKCKQMQ